MQVKIGNQENLTINTSLKDGNVGEGGRRKEASKQRKNTIFAGDLPMNQDPIALRRQQAKKKAMEFVRNAWNGDRKMDQSQAEIREVQRLQREEALYNGERVKESEDRKENLRQKYGVEADSQEQKDLELLMRAQYPDAENPLTEEEWEKVQELREQPLTEYQEKCLEINKEEAIFKNRQESADNYADYLQSSLTDMKVERLKYHKMADAQKKAEKVMEQASEDIQGLLWEEAKDHVDETYEEQREEAKKEAEEKEEREEKIELRKEQRELIEARVEAAQQNTHEAEEAQRTQSKDAREEAQLLKDMAEAGLDVAGANSAVKAEIKDMLNKLKLVEADIKGIEIDEEI